MAIVSASLFRQSFRFENPVKSQDEAGGHSEDYQGKITTRGMFKKRDGTRELQEDTRVVMIEEYEAYCYWRQAIQNMLNKDTVLVYDGKFFQILSYGRYDEDRRFMQFKLVAAE